MAGWIGARSRHLLAALLLVALPGAAAPEVPRFGSGTELVVLSAIALDKRGRPVTDLRPEEFRILEEGHPRPLQHFAHGPTLPARLLILVDASGSMSPELKTTSVRMAIVQILSALRPEDEVALAGFDDGYFGLVPFTRDHSAIEKAFADLRPWGSTALHDALDRAAHDLASHGEGRRAVVVITDGLDTSSQSRPQDVMARSRTLDVPIYAISVVSPVDDPGSKYFAGGAPLGSAAQGAEVLAQYAAMSGGAAFVASDFANLKLAADQIVRELAHQYRLGYVPPPGPARFRRVEVRVTRRDVVVRTRSGYVPRS
jgi:Ca-activated chloride channel homolog